MSKNCINPDCGKEIQTTATYCPYCGAQQAKEEELTEEQRLKKRIKELTEANAELRNTNKELRRKNKGLQKQIDELQKQIDELRNGMGTDSVPFSDSDFNVDSDIESPNRQHTSWLSSSSGIGCIAVAILIVISCLVLLISSC